ncbi:hypothetical protein E2C01_002237 [Portunus trituberculatus]|uniref:Uncharacterized protein n=1 Tax=Portunus trituberculatus TaxID=210409 RepID=A0A5B7CLF4_PORTR|nr:hypothetical protein [Portunus trituberculatus]
MYSTSVLTFPGPTWDIHICFTQMSSSVIATSFALYRLEGERPERAYSPARLDKVTDSPGDREIPVPHTHLSFYG